MHSILFISLAVLLSSAALHAQLVVFSFNGSAGNESTFAPDAQPANGTVGNMSRGSGLTPSSAAGTFSSTSFTTGTLDTTDFYSFTITPDAGFDLTLTSLQLDERRSSTGITSWSVRSSLDNFSSDLSLFNVPDDTNTRLDQTTTLGAAFQNLTSTIEFRIYGFASESGAGTWRIDNVEAFGSFSPVPEPEEYALAAALGLVGFAFWRRKFARAA
ncbi:MAG: hypothetical protein AB1813_05085 [Verrucomicrobiota bacterium]|jgi:hypothetical protein